MKRFETSSSAVLSPTNDVNLNITRRYLHDKLSQITHNKSLGQCSHDDSCF